MNIALRSYSCSRNWFSPSFPLTTPSIHSKYTHWPIDSQQSGEFQLYGNFWEYYFHIRINTLQLRAENVPTFLRFGPALSNAAWIRRNVSHNSSQYPNLQWKVSYISGHFYLHIRKSKFSSPIQSPHEMLSSRWMQLARAVLGFLITFNQCQRPVSVLHSFSFTYLNCIGRGGSYLQSLIERGLKKTTLYREVA